MEAVSIHPAGLILQPGGVGVVVPVSEVERKQGFRVLCSCPHRDKCMSSPWKRRKPRLGDAVSSSLRMLSWALRMVHFGLTPERKEISGLIYHLSAKCLPVCGLKEATPALRVGPQACS